MSLLKKPKFNTRLKKSLLIGVALLLLVPCVAAAAFAVRFDTQDPAAQEQERKEKELLEMKLRAAGTLEQKQKVIADDPTFQRELERKREMEVEMRAIMHAALIRLAKINMDQAIVIATTQQPGKVLMCSLSAKGWEEPGKLGKDGVVFYHVVIADEVKAGESTHVWVNAIDGSVIKTEKELPRKMRSPEGN